MMCCVKRGSWYHGVTPMVRDAGDAVVVVSAARSSGGWLSFCNDNDDDWTPSSFISDG